MTNHKNNSSRNYKDYTDEEMQQELQSFGCTIQPSENLLYATLEKISSPKKIVVSPLNHHFSFWKIGAPVFIVALLLIGSVTLIPNHMTPEVNQPIAMTSPTDTSDAALDQDTSVIDSELGALDTDVASTDQILNVPHP